MLLAFRTVMVVLVLAGIAGADVIPKWRTPEGQLHFGDRPPPGSVLLETIEFADSAPAPAEPVGDDALARAAADGREIMRQRAADRLHRETVVASVLPPVEEPANVAVFGSGVPFFHRPQRRFHDFDDFHFDGRRDHFRRNDRFGGHDRFRDRDVFGRHDGPKHGFRGDPLFAPRFPFMGRPHRGPGASHGAFRSRGSSKRFD